MGLFSALGGIAGNLLLPGVGGLVGSGLGGALGGLFGGGGGGSQAKSNPSDAYRTKTMALLDDQIGKNVYDSAGYRSGSAEITRQTREQAGVDEAAAARRGLAGGEFEIAQGANRQRAAAGSLSRLGQQASGERSQLMQMLLGATGEDRQIDLTLEEQARQRKTSGLTSAFGTIAGLIPSLLRKGAGA